MGGGVLALIQLCWEWLTGLPDTIKLSNISGKTFLDYLRKSVYFSRYTKYPILVVTYSILSLDLLFHHEYIKRGILNCFYYSKNTQNYNIIYVTDVNITNTFNPGVLNGFLLF